MQFCHYCTVSVHCNVFPSVQGFVHTLCNFVTTVQCLYTVMFSLLYKGLYIHCAVLSLLYSVCTLCSVVISIQMFVRCFNIVLLSILYHVRMYVSVRFRYTLRMSRYQWRTDWQVGDSVCESRNIHSVPIPDTVEPVHKDHPRDQELMIFIQRCFTVVELT